MKQEKNPKYYRNCLIKFVIDYMNIRYFEQRCFFKAELLAHTASAHDSREALIPVHPW